jgi:Carboxypeptidase regulatory-like domain
MLAGARTATSEGDGSFAFDGLVATKYRVTAERDGLYGEDDIALDETSEPLVIRLVLAPRIVVHVRDAAGPLAGATVETNSRKSVSDAAGDATLRGIDTGYEFITVAAAGHAPLRLVIETDDPGASLERTVTLASAAPLEGTVVGPDGPVAEATVDLERPGGEHESATTDATGHWRFAEIGAGRHVISASAARYIAMPDAIVETDGVHRKADVVVHVGAGGEVRGIVVDRTGAPVADAHVNARHFFETTDEHGRFTATGLPAGTYDVSATSDLGATRDVSVELAAGGRADVRLVLEPGSIAGIVVDPRGEPVEDVRVVAENKEGNHSSSTRSDEHGHFDLGGVLPGEYLISVGRGRRRDLPPGIPVVAGNRHVRLVVADGATLTGRVIGDGAPVPYFGIQVTHPPDLDFGNIKGARTRDGRFAVHDLPEGERGVLIVAPGFAPKAVPAVQLAAGRTVDLGDIVLDRGRIVRGRVVDERGAPIAGATVEIASSKGIYTPDTLRALVEGTVVARTDLAGAFEISGLLPDTDRRIEARIGGAISIDRPLGATESYVELVVVRSGGIDGWISNMDTRQSHAVATSAADASATYRTDIDGAGTFHFDALPPGDYVVHVAGHNAIPPRQVTVVAGAHIPLVMPWVAEPDQ